MTGATRQAQSQTGTPNHVYDLVSVLYHALKSSTTDQQYIQDAQQAGNDDLVRFFQQLQQEDQQRAEKAKQLLGKTMTPSH
ncbi:MAG: hypothetical protein IVW57_06030 [Ktedonobacterales bacterium]|nr:hypothetical protein [Ktedonobacterales bacterium]